MDGLLTPADVEALAAANGKTMREVCGEAQIANSTYTRWKRGKTHPTLDVYRRVVGAAGSPKQAAEAAA